MKPFNKQLGFGSASLTSMKRHKDIKKLLNTAYEQGICHFDTAVLYGKGYSELILGQFIKDKREHVTITTKFGLGQPFRTRLMPIKMLLPLNFYLKSLKKSVIKTPLATFEPVYQPVEKRAVTKQDIQKNFMGSLSRLKTDYLDYYLIHEGLPQFLTSNAFDFLLGLKEQGRVRNIGIGSNILDINTLTPENVKDWDVLQYEGYNIELLSEVMQKFPDKTHFHHSCLKDRDGIVLYEVAVEEKIGYMLAQAALYNPNGKIIFSTRNQEHLLNNLNSFNKYTTT